ncbi:YccF domain-containing protein, partial [Rhizobium ruizarguesonis]
MGEPRNGIWFVFGGWYLALLWLVGEIVAAFTVIGLPISRAALEMAK